MANRFLNNITINDSYTLPSSDGNADQVIKTDGAGNLSFTDIVAGEADKALSLTLTVKNTESVALTKGQVVCAAPTATPPSGNVIEVKLADNNGTDSMPAIGILNEGLDAAGGANDEGEAIMFGRISGINTSAFSVGDEVFVSDTPGGLTATKPTGVKYIQKVGVVMRDDASNGTIEVFGAGRTNDVPTPLYIDHANQRVGIGEETPSSELHINNDSTAPELRLSYEPAGGYGGGGDIRIQGASNDYVYGGIGWYNGANRDAHFNYAAATRVMSFTVNDRSVTTNGYFRFYNDNTEVAEINANGIYGNVFYDNNNTNYYANPASTNNSFNALGYAHIRGGITTDGNARSYTWRALDNTGSSGTRYQKIARITSSQSSRFVIELAGRSTSYSDPLLPALGYIVGQLNNDNNYDLVFYNHSGEDTVVDEVGQVDVSTTATDIYIKVSSFSEVTAHAHISDGTIAVESTSAGSTEPTNYVAATNIEVWNSRNDGSGSGLDADLLDGQHASEFAASSHNHDSDYVELTGDTMSGPLVIDESDTTDKWLFRVDNNGSNFSGFWSASQDIQLYLRDDAGNVRVQLKPDARSIFYDGLEAANLYDSDNTAYYVNPSSTSTSLNVAGDASVRNVYIGNLSGSISNRVWFNNGGIYQPGLYFDGNNPKFIINSLVTSIFHDTYHPNADTWTTARTITIGNTGKTVDGSADVSWSLSEIGAASSSHNHDSDYVNVTGDTMTGALTASGGINGLTLSNGISGSNFNITGVNQLSINDPGEGILFGGGANNVTLYAIDDSTDNKMNFGGASELQVNGSKVFHDGYHPNADTLTTARTISLTGDVTGSVSFNGSSNVSITTTVANNSHQHNVLYENSTITYGASQLQWMDINGTGGTGLNGSNPQNPTNDWHYHMLMNHANSNGYYIDLAFDFHDDNVWFQRNEAGTLQGWRQMFHDGYHPNADTWTSSRTITIGNTGKSVNGSANVSWSLSEIGAAASSHTHDDRYYTETEMQTFFNRGYISAQSASNLAIGWYTIATNTGNRALGEFQIWDVASSRHQSVLFNASHHYGTDNSNDITVLANSRFGTDVFRYLRIREGGTYDGAALQVYIDNSTNSVNVAITGANAQSSGWVLKDWIPNATDPGDVDNYSSFTNKCQVDLDNIQNGGIATTGDIFSGGALTQYRNLTTADEGSGNGLDADTLDGQHASAFLTSYTETDTLDSVADRGRTTNQQLISTNSSGFRVDSGSYARIEIDSNNNWSYIRLQDNATVSWDIASYNGGNLELRPGGSSSNRTYFDSSGNSFSEGSKRAPIFYDSDNTSYYLNPASTSVLNDVSGTRIWAGYDSNVDNSVSCSNWFRSSGSTGWYNGSYGGGIYMADSTWVRVYNNKKFYADDTIESNTGMYAPIFYDRNDTSYYVDPASTSTAARLNGDILLSNGKYFGFDTSFGTPGINNYFGALSTNTTLYVGGPTGTTTNLYSGYSRASIFYNRANSAYYMDGDNTGDSIRVAGDVVAYYSSDKRLKDNIKPIENALDKVNAISGVTFEWNEKSHKTTGRKDVGVIAQEVEEVFPEIVETRSNGYKAVDYQKLTAVLIESVKELTAKVEALESKQCNCK